jgi:hypothetical protein
MTTRTNNPPPFERPLIGSTPVMNRFGYKSRGPFWDFVRREGVPHFRLNARRILFDEQQLNDWLASRSSTGKGRAA